MKISFTNKNKFPMLGNLLNRTALLVFIFIGLGTIPLFAQLNDMEMTDANTAPYTPESLITNVFLGNGVEVTSFQFDGDPTSIGFFKNGLEEIGIDRGIVMTTGRAAISGTMMGSDGIGSNFASSSSMPNITADADLTQLVPDLPNNDIARYTISFIPTSDTVRFRYSFASEEYPEYACSAFNDIFGFFISGPGINGPFSNNADNIALIPGTGEFVSINNLHPQNGGSCPAVNEQFYNDNNGSNNQPVYDGITDVFTAEAIVIPCMEYTIKLVIADKGDTVFDSGVFLEAKSFGSPALDVDLVTVSPDGTVVEGCSEGAITIGVPNPVEEDTPLDYTILGTATNGVDYQMIPLDLFIPAGESSVTIPIIAFEDGLDEGLETICIDIQRDICNRDTFCIYINDNQLVEPDLGPDLTQCQADTVQLMGELDIELPEPPFFTSQSSIPIFPHNTNFFSPITVAGVQPFNLGEGVIQSVCINLTHPWVDDIDLFLIAPGGQFIELSTDNGANGDNYTNACFTPTASTPINSPGPFAPFEAAPFTGEWLPEGPWADLWFNDDNPTNGEWQLLIIDDGMGFDTGILVEWNITFEPLFQVEYKWEPSEGLSCDDCPNPFATPQETTTYVLTSCDTYGCTVTDEMTVTVESSLPAPNVICSEINVDCITFSWDALPGASGYEVSVNGGAWMPANSPTSHEVCGLTFNQQVFIEVRGLSDCNGFVGIADCMTPDCDGAIPTVENIQSVTCNGGSNGSLLISAAGNFPPFVFSANGETNQTGEFSGLPAGIYDVAILDAGGCEVILPLEVSEPGPLELQNAIQNHVTCNGADDGSATVIIGGGTAPFQFEWSNAETDSIAVALPPGDNNLLVTDAMGCQEILTITITEPEPMSFTTSNEIVQCNGDNTGMAAIAPEGGQQPYLYLWNDDLAQTQDTAFNLTAGTYEVTVTDNSNCSITASVIVDENPAISSITTDGTATCNGTTDGMATVEGQDSPFGFYTYQWDENANNQTTGTATNLDVGIYYVTISDFFNCSIVDSVEITSPNAMMVDYTAAQTFCPESVDGAASVTVNGGVMPYSYAWADNGATTADRDDLPSGITIVTITDANDCFVELEVDVPSPTPIEAELEVTNAACNATATGGMICTILPNSGGAEPYSYTWANGTTSSEAINLSFGMMCVTVTDNNGCTLELCDEVQQPEALQIDFTTTFANCFAGNEGMVDITVNGGTPDPNGAYTYNWSNGTTNEDATALTAGTYTVEVMDANACTATGTYTIEEPSELTASTEFTPSSCNGDADGTATVNPDGGTAPYTYTWDDDATSDTQTASNLLDGLFNVTVTDANGCTIEAMASLPTPELIIIDDISGTNINCNAGTDGTATVVATGGTGTLYYEWVNTQNTTANATQLSAGTYTVIITDDAACEASETITITEPEALNANLNQVSAFCFNGNDGTASVTNISYGNTPAALTDFTYAWNTIPVQTTATATGLTGGQSYSVVITDAAACSITETITVDNPAEIGSSIANTINVSCFAENDGETTVLVDGGTLPYTYAWGANAANQTTATATELTAGTYSVLVTDASGCTTNASIQITEPTPLALTFEADPTSCGGAADGYAKAIGNGGTLPYTYAWPNGETEDEVATLVAASYMVTLTDANGCTIEEEVRIDQPDPVVTEVMLVEDVSCAGLNDGMIELSSTGGAYPYQYSIDGENYLGTSRLIALEAGIYDVFIRDANGCEFVLSDIEIEEPNPIELDLGADIIIEYGDEPTLNADVTNANGNLIYQWRPIGPNELSCYDCPNPSILDLSYQLSVELTVTDENGCSDSDILLIQVNKDRNVVVPTGFAPNDQGASENNALHVHGGEGTEIKLFRVFDRWGNLLYEATDFMVNDMNVGWDGTFRGQEVSSGVYVWYIEAEYEDGEEGTFKGNTTLIR